MTKAILLAAALAAAPFTVAAAAPAGPTVADLVEVPKLTHLSVSPDGRWAVVREEHATIADNDHHLTWKVIDLQGKVAPRTLPAGDFMINNAGVLIGEPSQWSADSSWFYFRKLQDQELQIWRARTDGGPAEQVTRDLADIEDFVLDPVTGALDYRVGDTRAAVIALEEQEYAEGVLSDGKIEPGQNVYHGMRIAGRAASQRLTGKWFSRRGLGAEPTRVRHLAGVGQAAQDVEASAAKTYTERLAQLQPEAIGVDRQQQRNAAGAAVRVSGYGPEARLIVTPAKGAAVTCGVAACQGAGLQNPIWSRDGREVIFTVRGSDWSQVLYAWRPGRTRPASVRKLVAGDGLLDDGDRAACGLTAAALVCVAAEANAPPRLETIALKDGHRAVVYDPSAADRARLAAPIRRLSWSDGKGHDFKAVLFLPQGLAPGARAPLFIQYYSCEGYVRGGTGDEYPFAAMAQQGLAALCINQTRITSNPETYDALFAYDVAVDGIGRVIRQLADEGLIDDKKVGIGGLSFGSEVTMRTLTTTKLAKAASISSVAIEPIYFWYNYAPGRDFQRILMQTWKMGSQDATPARWKEVSPALNTDKIDAALLMQMPEQESRYNYELMGRLQMRGTPTEMYIFPDEPHIKYQPRHKAAVYQRNIDWFRFWLAGQEDPDPAKAGQYARWRALRDKRAAATP